MTLASPACLKGTQPGNSSLASFQEHLEGTSGLKSYQLAQLVGWQVERDQSAESCLEFHGPCCALQGCWYSNLF